MVWIQMRIEASDGDSREDIFDENCFSKLLKRLSVYQTHTPFTHDSNIYTRFIYAINRRAQIPASLAYFKKNADFFSGVTGHDRSIYSSNPAWP